MQTFASSLGIEVSLMVLLVSLMVLLVSLMVCWCRWWYCWCHWWYCWCRWWYWWELGYFLLFQLEFRGEIQTFASSLGIGVSLMVLLVSLMVLLVTLMILAGIEEFSSSQLSRVQGRNANFCQLTRNRSVWAKMWAMTSLRGKAMTSTQPVFAKFCQHTSLCEPLRHSFKGNVLKMQCFIIPG